MGPKNTTANIARRFFSYSFPLRWRGYSGITFVRSGICLAGGTSMAWMRQQAALLIYTTLLTNTVLLAIIGRSFSNRSSHNFLFWLQYVVQHDTYMKLYWVLWKYIGSLRNSVPFQLHVVSYTVPCCWIKCVCFFVSHKHCTPYWKITFSTLYVVSRQINKHHSRIVK